MTLAIRGPAIPPFYAGEIGRRAAVHARAGRSVVTMHFGQPTEGAPPAALAAAWAAIGSEPSGYWESAALRERIAQHYRETYGVEVPPQRILLTAGASAALVALFTTFFAHGDRVGVLRPGYPAYRNALSALGRTPVEFDVDPPRAASLLSAIDALDAPLQGLIIASPSNPTGDVLDADTLRAIADGCRARDIRLIADEIYHGITFGAAAYTMLSFEPAAVVVNSFSKFFRMPGWRLGWIIAPEEATNALSAHLTNFFLTPSTIAQHAALAAFDDIESLYASVERYRENRGRLVSALSRLGFGRFRLPEGAFYLYVDASEWTNDSLAFCERLLDDTGLSIAPGIDFDSRHGDRFVRFSYAISSSRVDDAVARLERWLPSQRRIAR